MNLQGIEPAVSLVWGMGRDDEGKVIGCLTGTGGVADETEYLLQHFGKRGTTARIFTNEDPERLIDDCLNALK